MRDARGGRPGCLSSRQSQNAARRRAHGRAARLETAARRATRQTRAIPPLIFRAIQQARAVSLKSRCSISISRRPAAKQAAGKVVYFVIPNELRNLSLV